jgi:hypothetical protein
LTSFNFDENLDVFPACAPHGRFPRPPSARQ